MPLYFIYFIYTAVFALILIVTVPKEEIRRLSIYGIIFGGLADIPVLIFGKLTGLFYWINYGPLGIKGICIFSNLSWAMFFIMYFYFLPKQKPLNYIFIGAGVVFSVLYHNLVIDLGIFYSYNRYWVPIIAFSGWFIIVTWGFYKINNYIETKNKLNKC